MQESLIIYIYTLDYPPLTEKEPISENLISGKALQNYLVQPAHLYIKKSNPGHPV